MIKLGRIVFVLFKLFLLASSQDATEVSTFDNLVEVSEEAKHLTGLPPQPQEKFSIAFGNNCKEVPEDPGYADLVGSAIGLIPDVGGPIAWLFQAALLGQKISSGSRFYACDTDEKLQQQLDRILAQAKRYTKQNDAENAFNDALSFFQHVGTYNVNGLTLADQDFGILAIIAAYGTRSLNAALSADILGAEIMGEVAIFLAAVQIIQIGKAEDWKECGPAVTQLVHTNIAKTINHLEKVKQDNIESKSDLTCAWQKPFNIVSGTHYCDDGHFVCNSGGTIVYELTAEDYTGQFPDECVKIGAICSGRVCRDGCKQWGCPSSVTRDVERNVRQDISNQFDVQLWFWLNGRFKMRWHGSFPHPTSIKEPNNKGVEFYLTKLKEMKTAMSYEEVTKQCGRGNSVYVSAPTSAPTLSPTLSPTPAPTLSPTPAPTPSPIDCIRPGQYCGISLNGKSYKGNCSECCSGRYMCKDKRNVWCNLDCV